MSCAYCGGFDDYLANFEAELGGMIDDLVADPAVRVKLWARLMADTVQPEHRCESTK